MVEITRVKFSRSRFGGLEGLEDSDEGQDDSQLMRAGEREVCRVSLAARVCACWRSKNWEVGGLAKGPSTFGQVPRPGLMRLVAWNASAANVGTRPGSRASSATAAL